MAGPDNTVLVIWKEWVPRGVGHFPSSRVLFMAPPSSLGRLRRYRCKMVKRGELRKFLARLKRSWLTVKPGSVEVWAGPASDPHQYRAGVVRPNVCEQSYLGGRSLGGVDAPALWNVKGGRGSDTKIVVFDFGAAEHPEFEGAEVGGISRNPSGCGCHGTQVLSVLLSRKHLLGLAIEAKVEFCLVEKSKDPGKIGNLFPKLFSVVERLPEGSVVVLPIWGLKLISGEGIRGIPVEAWGSLRTVIRRAVARGIHVIMSAGNSQRNLRDFVPWWADSGAIVVGAGLPHAPVRTFTSNYGRRVDVHQWGEYVLSACCNGSYEYFSGTSAATAIVAGVVASLVSVLKECGCAEWRQPRKLRRLLHRNGYWKTPGIGTRPSALLLLEHLARRGVRVEEWRAGRPPLARLQPLLAARRAVLSYLQDRIYLRLLLHTKGKKRGAGIDVQPGEPSLRSEDGTCRSGGRSRGDGNSVPGDAG